MEHNLSPTSLDKVIQTFQVPGYNIRLASSDDGKIVEEAGHLLSTVWLTGEPLSTALASDPALQDKGVVEQIKDLCQCLCKEAANHDFLMVTAAPDGKLAAVWAAIPYGTEYFEEEGPIIPFFDILNQLDPAIETLVKKYNGTSSTEAKVLELYGTACLPEHRRHGLCYMMGSALSAIGLLRGYTHVVVKLTSAWQAALPARGIPFVQEIEYGKYEHEGKRPFSTISEPRGVHSILMEAAVFQILIRPKV